VGDVIEEDHPQADAAKKVEPQIALDRRQECCLVPYDHGPLVRWAPRHRGAGENRVLKKINQKVT
jgi:hypothetical protein